jgi:hypothetical protein
MGQTMSHPRRTHCTPRLKRATVSAAAFILLFLCGFAAWGQSQISTSALIGQALDQRITDLNVHGALPEVMKAVESQTGVRVEAAEAVWDALPWGQETDLTVRLQNCTVRQALQVISRRLGLTFRLAAQAVVLEPSPPLRRLGRRATLEEIGVLDLLASTPLGLADGAPTIRQLLSAADTKLADLKSPFAVQDRAFDDQSLGQIIHVARNATMMQAMEEITEQTGATWYPWGQRLVIVPKLDATRLLLTKRLSRRYRGEELAQVLTDLSEFSQVSFAYAPGVLRLVPAKYQRVTLTLNDATVQQTLAILSGATGLKFTPTGQGVSVTYQPARP